MLRGLALLAVTWLAIPAAADDPRVAMHSLQNGMRVLVREDHAIPSVAVYFFFRVGSRNERPGVTGISHFLEHMMFNGAREYGPRQFDIALERNGGEDNAYTTRDVTVYTDWAPRSALELVIRMEADRIRDLRFDANMIESERGVVTSEQGASVGNDNFGLLLQQLYATAFQAHPYRWPVLGWKSDIEAWTEADLRAHYRMGYGPNNCVLAIAGDTIDAEALALAKKYLEAIPAHEGPPPVRTREPAQRGERRATVRKTAQVPLMMAGFHVPASNHPDYWPLQVLATMLADGRSSRLYTRLVEREQAAESESGWMPLALDPGLMVFSVQPAGAAAAPQAERGLLEELARAGAAEAPAWEIGKARNLLLAAYYRRLRTNSGMAAMLGEAEIYFGGWREAWTVPGELERVSAADVVRVARKYLGADNRTLVTLVPAAAAAGAAE